MKTKISLIIASVLCIIIGAFIIFAKPLQSLASNETEWIEIGWTYSSHISDEGVINNVEHGMLEVRVINDQFFYRFNGDVVSKSSIRGFNACCNNKYLNVPHY